MDRALVRFLRRKSLTAHCIFRVVEQHIRIEPGRVNREDYATGDKCQLFLLLCRVSWAPKCPHFFLSSYSCGRWQELLNRGLIHPAPQQWLCVYLPWSNRIWFALSLVHAMSPYDWSLALFCAVWLPLMQLRNQLNILLLSGSFSPQIADNRQWISDGFTPSSTGTTWSMSPYDNHLPFCDFSPCASITRLGNDSTFPGMRA
jgi:hypothetical protein